VRQGKSLLVVDPVIPKTLDGLKVELNLAGSRVKVSYCIKEAGFGPTKVNLNGADLPFARGANPYRTGAAEIAMAAFREYLIEGTNRLTVHIG
jgi:cellobiose phosphorylase